VQVDCHVGPGMQDDLALARRKLQDFKTTSRDLHGDKTVFTLPLTELPSTHQTFQSGFK
jgi:hypothetical protein